MSSQGEAQTACAEVVGLTEHSERATPQRHRGNSILHIESQIWQRRTWEASCAELELWERGEGPAAMDLSTALAAAGSPEAKGGMTVRGPAAVGVEAGVGAEPDSWLWSLEGMATGVVGWLGWGLGRLPCRSAAQCLTRSASWDWEVGEHWGCIPS